MHEFLIPRRRCLEIGGAAAITALVPAQLLSHDNNGCAPAIPNGTPANGGPCPYPIPWLDKNGNHNQMPKPNVELSHIFHFKGKLARCAGFTGMGTDNHGNRLAWGTATTDFSYMAGEYWAARAAQQGVYAHI
jgi:hypothetical protein